MDGANSCNGNLLSSYWAYIQQFIATIHGGYNIGKPCDDRLDLVCVSHTVDIECSLWLPFAVFSQPRGSWFPSFEVSFPEQSLFLSRIYDKRIAKQNFFVKLLKIDGNWIRSVELFYIYCLDGSCWAYFIEYMCCLCVDASSFSYTLFTYSF